MSTNHFEQKDIALQHDGFVSQLVRELTGKLESLVGLEQASGYIALVAKSLAEWIEGMYEQGRDLPPLDPAKVADMCIDLKRRIDGDFYIHELDEEKIVFGNRRCPFGDKVIGRTSLCMMTSGVFGHISAKNLGYSKVCLNKTIARGDKECLVTVYYQMSDTSRAEEGIEYFPEIPVSR